MAFRLLNIGDGQGIVPSSYLTVIDGYTYSRTGKAFTGAVSGTNYSSYLFTLPDYTVEDIWISVDLYLDSTSTNSSYFYLGYWNSESVYNSKNFAWMDGLYLNAGIIRVNMTNSYSNTQAKGKLELQEINKIICNLHNESGENNSYAELNLNGTITSQSRTRKSDAYAIGATVPALKTMAIAFPKNYPCYVSNLIISDREISPKERVIALPISRMVTNMTAGASGLFIADAANQTLLQTPDVSSLIENYGASSAVTGIMLVGNPAYATGAEITSLIGLSQSAGVSAVEHGTCNLSEDTDAVIMDGWSLDNMTIAGLSTMQFGWKAGE